MSVTEGASKITCEGLTVYQLRCGCGDPKCGFTLTTDYAHQAAEVTISGNLVLAAAWHVQWKWYRLLWERIKVSMKVLFTGNATAEAELYVPTPDHLYGIIGALLEARRCMIQTGKPFRQAGRLEDKSGP